MAVNGWKIVAIIFIVLFILETIGIAFVFKMGIDSIQNENKCANEICFNKQASSYIYESYSNLCQCYNSEAEVFWQEKL